MKKAILRKSTYISIAVCLFIIAFGTIYINNLNNYKKEVAVVKEEIKSLNQAINSVSYDDRTHLKKLVDYYKRINSVSILNEKINKINNKKRYAILLKNSNANTLGINKLKNDFEDINKEIEILNRIMQKNDQIDKEILSIKSGGLTYNTTVERYKEILESNKELKRELSGIFLSSRFNEAYSNFLEALTYKQKYLLLMVDGTNTEVDYLAAKNLTEDTREKGLRYIKSDYAINEIAETYVDLYKESKKRAEEKQEQSQLHYLRAEEMIIKYKELYGI